MTLRLGDFAGIFGEICKGWSLNKIVLAQRQLAPFSMAARMPSSLSGKAQPWSCAGEGWAEGVMMLFGLR